MKEHHQFGNRFCIWLCCVYLVVFCIFGFVLCIWLWCVCAWLWCVYVVMLCKCCLHVVRLVKHFSSFPLVFSIYA